MEAPLTTPGGLGKMAMPPPRYASSSCTASSARTLVHVAQTLPQVLAVPNVRFLILTCHRDDRGASGRGVSFKLPGWLSSSRVGPSIPCESLSRQNTAREGRALPARTGSWCKVGVSKPRDPAPRAGGQSPRYRETHGTGGRTGSVVGMLGLRCRLTSGHPPQGRPTQKLAGD